MIDDFKGERTRLETKVKGLEAEVNQLNSQSNLLKSKVTLLEWEEYKLRKVIHDTRAELLAAEGASEVCMRGGCAMQLYRNSR